MYSNIPPHVLLFVYTYLDLKDKLSASSSCKIWRETLFCESCLIFKELNITFECAKRKSKIKIDTEYIGHLLKFIGHSDTFVLQWSQCWDTRIVSMLTAVAKQSSINYRMRKFIFRPRWDGFCLRSCKVEQICSSSCIYTDISESVCHIIKCSKKLKVLDLGFESKLVECVNLRKTIIDAVGQGVLNVLNISAIGNENINSPGTSFNTAGIVSCLKVLCVSWDEDFSQLVELLSTNERSAIHLKYLVPVIRRTVKSNDCSFCQIPNKKWLQLQSNLPDIKIKLMIVNQSSLRDLTTDFFNEEMPLCSINVVVSNIQPVPEVFVTKVTQFYKNRLEEVSLNNIDTHSSSFQICWLMRLFAFLPNIKRIRLSGFFIEDSDVLDIAKCYCKMLEEYSVYQAYVVKESNTTGYLLPIGNAQAYGLEKAISIILGRDWTLDKSRRQKLNISYKYTRTQTFNGVPATQLQCAIQDSCGFKTC